MIEFHPGFILIIGALLATVLPQRIRRGVMVLAPLLAIAAVFNLKSGTVWTYRFIHQFDLRILNVDQLSWIFGLIFTIMALLGNIYALHIKKPWESAAGLAYAGSSLGVVFAGDWITLIFFWELMAVSSVLLIWSRKTPQAIGAGFRYILVHFFGGNILLAGIFLKVTGGQTAITALTGTHDTAFWLILIGIAINAAIPPLHAWLTDAYPEGTVTGSVFLSAFTTKVAVYCLIRVFPGTELLIWAGVAMALYGVVYAVLENDIRRLLAYHIISQVGYMVAAVGMGTNLALNGASAHAFSHILYKSLLFMGAGAVILSTGRRKLSELGGFFRLAPATVILYTIGAFSISGVPLFNGFISKSMIVSAASYHHLPVVELLLYLASIGTFLHTGLKLPYFMFFGPDRGIKPEKIPVNMYVAMSGGAFLCTLYGLFPSLLYQYLPFAAKYEPFTMDHVISAVQLLVATLAAFWVFIPKLGGEPTISVDTDWFYRRPLIYLVNATVKGVLTLQEATGVHGKKVLGGIIAFFANPLKWIPLSTARPVEPVYSADKYRFPVGAIILTGIMVFIMALALIYWIV